MDQHTDEPEWLEADGLGGYAMGTVLGERTRRYHGLLIAARTPPTDRVVLVAGLEVAVTTAAGTFRLNRARYLPGVLADIGAGVAVVFRAEPWPQWTWRLPDGTELRAELVMPHGHAATVLRWRLLQGSGAVELRVRPLLACRDHHGLQSQNEQASTAVTAGPGRVTFRPYPALPAVELRHNGAYRHEPHWYRDCLLREEAARGYDHREDLLAPGELTFSLAAPAVLVFRAGGLGDELPDRPATELAAQVLAAEAARRQALGGPLQRAADQYLVRRGEGRSIVAGYPWFTDWGRDTFLGLRGLLLATGRHAEAGAVLRTWAAHLSAGMLPNRFPDGGPVEYRSVDAALWFVVAAHEWLEAGGGTAPERAAVQTAMLQIVRGHIGGARHGIRMDDDGLLRCGAPGIQLTWMDAVVGGRVITERTGKPVEVQALWINALRACQQLDGALAAIAERALASFRQRFWHDGGWLCDVVDVDHAAGEDDATFRPNQILAVGGLPFALLEGERARAVVDAVADRLLTPLGLRTLSPGARDYEGRYRGDQTGRDLAYHQGTAWPWLLGPFVQAWLRVRDDDAEARAEARARFVQPLLDHLRTAGLGHVSEVADGDAPQLPGGCPFQAWSVGELLRLLAMTTPVAARSAPPVRRPSDPRPMVTP